MPAPFTTRAGITVARASEAGRACRDYIIYGADDTPLLEARAFPWRREIRIRDVVAPYETFAVLRRRLTFPLTGRVDIIDRAGYWLGEVRRSGTYCDRAGVCGRFRDARTFSDRARESLLIGIMDAIAGDGSSIVGSAPTAFVWLIADTAIGTLTRVPASSVASPVVAADHTATRMARLGRRLRQLAQRDEPRRWQLERLVPNDAGDEHVTVATALFTIELSQW